MDFEKLCREIDDYCRKRKLFIDDYYVMDHHMSFIINWGDWKHDHLRFDYLVDEYLRNNYGYYTKITQEILEDDGSDCYSGKHIVEVM